MNEESGTQCPEEEKNVDKNVIEDLMGDYIYKKSLRKAIEFTEERLGEIGICLAAEKKRKVINQVTSRIKSTDSIYKKMRRKSYSADRAGILKCNDLLGVRTVCLFMDDVYEVAECLKKQKDIRVLKEKDYIKKPKSNGYMSLHLIIEVPVGTGKNAGKDGDGKESQWRKVEVQLRTVAMDFWSVLDHQLVYKKEFPGAESIGEELKDYAVTIAELDKNMLGLREKIEHLNV